MSMFFAASAKEVTVSVGAGEHWKEKREPQFAVWLETADGVFLRTLYVTSRASKKKLDFQSERRPA